MSVLVGDTFGASPRPSASEELRDLRGPGLRLLVMDWNLGQDSLSFWARLPLPSLGLARSLSWSPLPSRACGGVSAEL